MEGWLLMEPWGGCAPPSDWSYWENKGLFMGADRLCFWRQSRNNIIVAIISFSCDSAAALPLKPCGSFPSGVSSVSLKKEEHWHPRV